MMQELYRSKLDGIVAQMESEGQPDNDIQFVVNDFKSKYDVPEPPPLPGTEASAPFQEGTKIAVDLPSRIGHTTIQPAPYIIERPANAALPSQTYSKETRHYTTEDGKPFDETVRTQPGPGLILDNEAKMKDLGQQYIEPDVVVPPIDINKFEPQVTAPYNPYMPLSGRPAAQSNEMPSTAIGYLGGEAQRLGKKMQERSPTVATSDRGQQIANSIGLTPDKVKGQGTVPGFFSDPEYKSKIDKMNLSQDDKAELYSYGQKVLSDRRRETGAGMEKYGKEQTAYSLEIDPAWLKEDRFLTKIDALSKENPDIANAFKRGDIGGATDIAIFDAANSGNKDLYDRMMNVKDQYNDMYSYQKAKEINKNGFEKLLNSTAEIVPMLGKGAALYAIPVVGPALGQSLWARQGAGDMLYQMTKQGVPLETALPMATGLGLVYANLEGLKAMQITQSGASAYLKKAIKNKIGAMIAQRGVNTVFESTEEALQQIVTDDGVVQAMNAAGMDKQQKYEFEDAFKSGWGAFSSSVVPFLMLGVPGTAHGVGKQLFNKNQKQTNQQTAPSQEIPQTADQASVLFQPAGMPNQTSQGAASPVMQSAPASTDKTLDAFALKSPAEFWALPAAKRGEIYPQLSPATKEELLNYEEPIVRPDFKGQDAIPAIEPAPSAPAVAPAGAPGVTNAAQPLPSAPTAPAPAPAQPTGMPSQPAQGSASPIVQSTPAPASTNKTLDAFALKSPAEFWALPTAKRDEIYPQLSKGAREEVTNYKPPAQKSKNTQVPATLAPQQPATISAESATNPAIPTGTETQAIKTPLAKSESLVNQHQPMKEADNGQKEGHKGQTLLNVETPGKMETPVPATQPAAIDPTEISHEDFVKLPAEKQKEILNKLQTDNLANPVTNVPGQRAYNVAFNRATDGGKQKVTVAFGDLNGLKEINDVIGGTEKGNQLLKAAYGFIAEQLPEAAIKTTHLHGDEYAVVAPGMSEIELQTRLAKAMKEFANNARFEYEGFTYRPTMSWAIGKAATNDQAGSINAKKVGKNAIGIDNGPEKEYNIRIAAEGVSPAEIITRGKHKENRVKYGKELRRRDVAVESSGPTREGQGNLERQNQGKTIYTGEGSTPGQPNEQPTVNVTSKQPNVNSPNQQPAPLTGRIPAPVGPRPGPGQGNDGNGRGHQGWKIPGSNEPGPGHVFVPGNAEREKASIGATRSNLIPSADKSFEKRYPEKPGVNYSPEYQRTRHFTNFAIDTFESFKNGYYDAARNWHPGGWPGWNIDYLVLCDRLNQPKSAQGHKVSDNARLFLNDAAEKFNKHPESVDALREIGIEHPRNGDDLMVWLQSSLSSGEAPGWKNEWKKYHESYENGQSEKQTDEDVSGSSEATSQYSNELAPKIAEMRKGSAHANLSKEDISRLREKAALVRETVAKDPLYILSSDEQYLLNRFPAKSKRSAKEKVSSKTQSVPQPIPQIEPARNPRAKPNKQELTAADDVILDQRVNWQWPIKGMAKERLTGTRREYFDYLIKKGYVHPTKVQQGNDILYRLAKDRDNSVEFYHAAELRYIKNKLLDEARNSTEQPMFFGRNPPIQSDRERTQELIQRFKDREYERSRIQDLTVDEIKWEDNNKDIDFFRNNGYTYTKETRTYDSATGRPTADSEKYWTAFERDARAGTPEDPGFKAFGISAQVDRGTGKESQGVSSSEPPRFQRRIEQTNLFEAPKTLDQLKVEEQRRLDRAEIKNRQNASKGGEANISGLPLFENQNIEGSQQTLFSRSEAGLKSKDQSGILNRKESDDVRAQLQTEILVEGINKTQNTTLDIGDLRPVVPTDEELLLFKTYERVLPSKQGHFVVLRLSDKAKKQIDFEGVSYHGTTFLSESHAHSTAYVLSHETIHDLARKHPARFGELSDFVNNNFSESGREKIKKLQDTYNLSEEQATEEVIADTFADNISRPSFWRDMYRKSPQLVKDILKALKSIYDKFLAAASKERRVNEKWFKDAVAVRRAIGRFISDAIAIENGKINADEAFSDFGAPAFARNDLNSQSADNAGSEATHGTKIENNDQGSIKEISSAPAFARNDTNPKPTNREFSTQFDRFLSGDLARHESINVSDTPQVLKLLGVPDLPVMISQDVLRKTMNGKHSVSTEELRKLPEAITSPIAVFDSATKPDSFVIMTEMKEGDKTVVVAIQVERHFGRNVMVNEIKSIYGKDSPLNFINWMRDGLTRYIDKKKSLLWARRAGLSLPGRGTLAKGSKLFTESDLNIPQSKTNVNNDDEPMFMRPDPSDGPQGADREAWLAQRRENAKHQIEEDTKLAVELSKAKQRLVGQLHHLSDEQALERAYIEIQLADLVAERSDLAKQAIYSYARSLGLNGVPYNQVDTMLKAAQTPGDIRNAVTKLDRIWEGATRRAAVERLYETVNKKYKRLQKIKQGTVKSTLDAEANARLEDYLNQLIRAPEETRDRINKLLTAFNYYGKKDAKPTGSLSELHDNVHEWIADPTTDVPESIKKAIKQLFAPAIETMSLAEITKAQNDIASIEQFGKTEKELKDDLLKKEIEETSVLIADQITKVTKGKHKTDLEKAIEGGNKDKGGIAEASRKFSWSLIDPERMVEWLVGWKDVNLIKSKLLAPIYKAEATQIKNTEVVLDRFKEIHKNLNMATADHDNAVKILVEIPGAAGTEGAPATTKELVFTMNQAMFVYANSKGEGNLAHLEGTGLSYQAIHQICEALPQKYRDAVDEMIKYFDNEQYPRMNEVFKEEHDIAMPRVDNYFPIQNIKTDRAESAVVADFLARYSSRPGSVQKGMTKSRVNSNAPFKEMDYFAAVVRNLVQTEHYIAYNDAIRSVTRYMNNPALRAAMEDKSVDVARHLKEWVKAVAYGRVQGSDEDMGKIINTLRQNFATYVLGFKLTTGLQQLSSFSKGAAMINKGAVLKSTASFMQSPMAAFAFADSKSPFIKSRTKNYERELAESAEKALVSNAMGKKAITKKIKELAMWHIGAIDKAVCVILWNAKYSEVMNRPGATEENAIDAADEVIRKTQSRGGVVFTAAIYRGNAFSRAFTMFSSDLNQNINIAFELAGKWGMESTPENIAKIFWYFVIPTFIVYMIIHAFKPDRPEEAVKTLVNQFSGALSFFGPIIDAAVAVAADKSKEARGLIPNKSWQQYAGDMTPTVLEPLDAFGKSILTIGGKKPLADKALSGWDATMQLTGIPWNAVKRGIKGGPTAWETKDIRYLFWSPTILKEESVFNSMARRATKPRSGTNDKDIQDKWYDGLDAMQKKDFDIYLTAFENAIQEAETLKENKKLIDETTK